VYSPSAKYYAIMQGDGNFVMYRAADSAVRFATMKYGSYVAMQSDGNLVEYSSTSTPLWSTATAGYPGAYMAVQDDGNLVVYSTGGAPLWNIGPDSLADAPSNVGDVPARDLNVPGLGWIGHVGVWTGSKIAEVVSGQTNAVRYVTWDSFRTTSNVWATARPNVPSYLVYYCFSTSCAYYNGTNYTTGIQSRMALASRANQAYLIGADYTTRADYYVPAKPSYPYEPAVRGVYRCDSFVVDVFWSIIGSNMNHPVPSAWNSRIDYLHWYAPYTPTSVWNGLKN
jgi:hypothetical protein